MLYSWYQVGKSTIRNKLGWSHVLFALDFVLFVNLFLIIFDGVSIAGILINGDNIMELENIYRLFKLLIPLIPISLCFRGIRKNTQISLNITLILTLILKEFLSLILFFRVKIDG